MQRTTQQRRRIREVFEELDRPLSPREVLTAASKRLPGLGIATVYRTIKALIEDNSLRQVDLPGESPRYERAGKGHHHHFRCRKCDLVFELRGCPGNLSRLLPRGFRLEEHEITLLGLCSRCR